jgi:hypothetical protein
MARYSILSPLLTVPRNVAIGQADTPAEAVRIAREFAKQGKKGLQIGDNEAAHYEPLETFAAKHGIR